MIGKENSNPLLDSSVYEVEFEDGTVERYHANIIAEHIYSQIDGDGYGRTLLDEIIDHRRDDTAIDAADGFVPGPNGSKVPKQTTRGWWLLVRLKDHTTEWYKLKDMKESNPLEVAQYAIDNKLEDEPAFKWWVSKVLPCQNCVISKVTSKYWRRTHKFGIRVPRSVEEALKLNEENGNHLWHDAIKKEMAKEAVAYTPMDRPIMCGGGKLTTTLISGVPLA